MLGNTRTVSSTENTCSYKMKPFALLKNPCCNSSYIFTIMCVFKKRKYVLILFQSLFFRKQYFFRFHFSVIFVYFLKGHFLLFIVIIYMQINESFLITYSINYKDKNNICGHCNMHVQRFRILIPL